MKKSFKYGLIALSVALSSIFVSGAFAQSTSNFFANNGFGNTVAYSPGVHYRGVTYISYQGPRENPWVASYNHNTQRWAGPYRAGHSILGDDITEGIDNHGRPSLVVDREGYIHVFYGGHGGDDDLHGVNPLGNTHSGEMRHRVSTRPFDISSWRTLDNIPPFGTYTQALTMGNGDIFLFYRHGAHSSDWVYQRSTDNGLTFEPPVSVLKSERINNPTTAARQHNWYLTIHKSGPTRINLAFNYHPENRPHDLERRNGYFMHMNTRTQTFRNVKNDLLRMPIVKSYADRNTLVVRTPARNWANAPKVVLDRDNSPHFTLNEGLNDGSRLGGPRTVKYYRWDKNTQRWTNNSDDDLPVGSPVMDVDFPRRAKMLIASNREGRGNGSDISLWQTTNGGSVFSKVSTVYRSSHRGVIISDEIVDAHPDARYVVADRVHRNYTNMVLLGDNGVIRRNTSDASVLSRAQREEPRR